MNHIMIFDNFNIKDHLKFRGIDPEKTQLIIDEEKKDVYFFLYNLSGQMVGYQIYNPTYKKKDKYLNHTFSEPHGHRIGVWGLESYDINSEYLFITEGIFDIARVHQSGYPGIAVLCNDPSPQLINWVDTLPQIKIVIYDNDKAGKKLKKLGNYSFSVKIGKDLNDLSQKDAKIFLDNIIEKIGK